MDAKQEMQTKGEELELERTRIRVTLSSRNVKAVETVCASVIDMCKEKELVVKGPMRMPTKRLRIVTRKAPNGEGTNTWDKFEMRLHKRVIDLLVEVSNVKDLLGKVNTEGVDVEVAIEA